MRLITRLKMYYDSLEEMPSVIYTDPAQACEQALEELEEMLEEGEGGEIMENKLIDFIENRQYLRVDIDGETYKINKDECWHSSNPDIKDIVDGHALFTVEPINEYGVAPYLLTVHGNTYLAK